MDVLFRCSGTEVTSRLVDFSMGLLIAVYGNAYIL